MFWSTLGLAVYLLLLQLSLVVPCEPEKPWKLTVFPSVFDKFSDKEITLRCRRNPAVPSNLVEGSKMTIYKKLTNLWKVESQAELHRFRIDAAGKMAHSSFDGSINNKTYIAITYRTSKPAFGDFVCNVRGKANGRINKRDTLVDEDETSSVITVSPLDIPRTHGDGGSK